MRNYDEGSRSGYVELPVPAAWVKWSRGDAKLATLKKSDPAAFYGGWRAFLQHKERGSDAMIDNPTLPVPVVDGGVFVLLIVEKIKGSPLSIRMQEVITYVGLVLIASLFLYLTYNDIIRLVSG